MNKNRVLLRGQKMLNLRSSDGNAHGSILVRNLRRKECNHLYENILVLFMCERASGEIKVDFRMSYKFWK